MDIAGLLGGLLGGGSGATPSGAPQQGVPQNAQSLLQQPPQDGQMPTEMDLESLLDEGIDESIVSDDTKGLFASVETSGDITGDWLQLEESTFKDLKKRGLIRKDIDFSELSLDTEVYDEVARAYIDDLMTTFGIPTEEDAALWSFRPGWYKKYSGDISKIPASAGGSFKKSGKKVMEERQANLNQYLEGLK